MPCILVVYDARESQAYWLYLQAYFESLEGFDLSKAGESVTVRLSSYNILNRQAIKIFAKFKNDVLSQLQGVIRHNG
ncbi:hypothetical protein NIES4071_07430 [Calothrix sp. NIES-4071]|nr:hypothetical protein NIES4071_07430 [Calothrix sp. NIES-4071]BAZ55085.1 hypothetical protein NIES4105_07390 [Calothrix sp. NIES-4105]